MFYVRLTKGGLYPYNMFIEREWFPGWPFFWCERQRLARIFDTFDDAMEAVRYCSNLFNGKKYLRIQSMEILTVNHKLVLQV